MNIRITRSNNEWVHDRNRILADFVTKDIVKKATLFLFFGLFFIAAGTVRFHSDSAFSWFFISFGAWAVYLSVLQLRAKIKYRKQLERNASQLQQFYDQSGNVTTIEITDRHVSVNSCDQVRSSTWSFFSGYRFYKGFIILIRFEDLPAEIFHPGELTNEELNELYAFLNGQPSIRQHE